MRGSGVMPRYDLTMQVQIQAKSRGLAWERVEAVLVRKNSFQTSDVAVVRVTDCIVIPLPPELDNTSRDEYPCRDEYP